MEDDNSLVQQASESAVKMLSKTGAATLGKTSLLEIVQEDISMSLKLGRKLWLMGFCKHFLPVCDVVDKMIDDGTPPDLVVDLTSRGSSTDVIQSLASNLGLPTIAATSAAEGELKYFKTLPLIFLYYFHQSLGRPE